MLINHLLDNFPINIIADVSSCKWLQNLSELKNSSEYI